MNALVAAIILQATAETIVITGRGLPDEARGEHRIVIDKEELSRSPSGRMEDVVRSIAGLTTFRRSDSRSTHPTAQGLTARGLGGNAASRFAVEVDGVPQADPFGGWINFVALDPALADRVILSRGGSGGVAHGPGALAGTFEIDSIATADSIFRGGVALGSRGSVAGNATVGAEIGASRFIAGTAWQQGDGFAPIVGNDRGPVDRAAPYRQWSGRIRLLAPVGRTEVQASLSAFDDLRDRGVDYTDNRGRGMDASLRMVGKDWSATGYGQWRDFGSQFASVGPGRETIAPALDQHDVPASGWGAMAAWKPRVGNLAMSLGADVRGVEGETNERYFFSAGIPQRERRAAAEALTYGLFADAEAKSGATTYGAGARIERWAISDASLFERNIGGAVITDIKSSDRVGHQWSARAGIDQKVSDRLALRATAYRSWRLPTINELVRPFRVGPDATAANAALDPETLHGVEAGIDWMPAASTRLSLTAFANRLGGAIANVTLGAGPGTFPGVGFVTAGGLYRRRENLDAIVSRGIEVDGEWRDGPWLLGGGMALTHARIKDDGLAEFLDGERPAQVPAVQASASGSWEDRGRIASLSLRYIGEQDESEADPEPLPDAWIVDVVGRWPIRGRLSLDLRAENLFDAKVITSILADGTRERGSPRTLWIGLRLD